LITAQEVTSSDVHSVSLHPRLRRLRIEQIDTGWIVWTQPNLDFTLGTYLLFTFDGELYEVTQRETEGPEFVLIAQKE
jgi:hypothetical protein